MLGHGSVAFKYVLEMEQTSVTESMEMESSALYNTINTTCDLYQHRSIARIVMPLHYSIVFIIGLTGNALALHVIRPNLKKMNSTTLYSTNLVISDILFTLSLPLRIVYYAMGFHWVMGDALCRITGLIFYINTYAGVNFMTCLSVDRFIAVVLPLRFSRFRKVHNVKYICLFVWFIVLAQTLPLLTMTLSKEVEGGYITCMEYPNFEIIPNLPYMLLGAVFLGYIIPVVTILVCYSGLCWKLQLSTKQKQFADKSGRNKKATRVIFFVTLVFVICFSPYHIDIVQHMIKKLSYDPSCSEQYAFQVSLHFAVCLMNFNSCMDPFIYFFACKGYKRKIMKIMKRQVSASFSSVVRTSPDGSARDVIDNKIVLVPLNSYKNKSQNSGKVETNTTVEGFTNRVSGCP
ncbi:G-protein coupled receptor 183-like isoform X1 [Acipenser ruthenus]|uniref:G-protein coupled receptor 183-like isoform X1 n=2 Tax=Acipenser ruthenus TaxID=7906 RepID=UPI0015614317|nr:G-protein coupled receptor 183-like isoform X1 [Acipenser ruthenus]